MKRTIVLRVRDARNKMDVRGVVAHAAHMLWQKGGFGHARDDEPLAGAGDSPFVLERRLLPSETLPLVVAAPGYAPELVDIGPEEKGEKLVELAPPGSVDFALADVPDGVAAKLLLVPVGAARRRLPFLRLSGPEDLQFKANRARDLDLLARGPDGSVSADLEYVRLLRSAPTFQTWPVGGRVRVRCDGLAPGDWAALLRVTVDGVPFDVGVVAFEIESGATASASLRARRDVDFPRRPIRGIVTVAAEWGIVPSGDPLLARLECVALDGALGAAGRPEALERLLVATPGDARLSFDFGGCWPGDYTLRIPRLEVSHRIVVTTTRDADVSHDLVVAPPAEVELTVHLAGSERPLDRARVAWSPVAVPCGDPYYFFDPRRGLAPDLESGRFRFRVPAVPTRISAALVRDDDELLPVERIVTAEEDFHLVPGRNVIALELNPTFLLVVILRDGMENVPLPEGARVVVERDGREVGCEWHRTGDGHACLDLAEAGRYRLTVTEIAGYDDPAPVSVELSRRRRDAVVAPVKRRADGVTGSMRTMQRE